MDPLAGIDSVNTLGPDVADDKDVFDVTTLKYNLQRVDTVRSVMNIASGCVAGICGVTGWQGLAVFLFLHLSVLAVVWATKMNCQLRSYTRQSVWSYATANVQQSGLSFTLFWTLFYGLVYLY
mmetsp:Transcript_22882/g.54032  ORF Transcript_22882/g.54032 Transcript_22882/m.54032 type:complete len:123 (+) Transcript_22882:333-701(+)|eukprot:CAMPEP_0172387042 /NCGR_PEP_ID=MMETSP1061-20121228/4454_1 /TAXON_ID=37318 /ORGANISM="Pseudo-nitzschia pungens, Strain cf. pungens" /LENGTH=122 /DNA_ID=CAMNT_0013116599 /DNA_START=272 /DNA_END=640 /DNA_ORIENTATION=-